MNVKSNFSYQPDDNQKSAAQEIVDAAREQGAHTWSFRDKWLNKVEGKTKLYAVPALTGRDGEHEPLEWLVDLTWPLHQIQSYLANAAYSLAGNGSIFGVYISVFDTDEGEVLRIQRVRFFEHWGDAQLQATLAGVDVVYRVKNGEALKP